MKGTIVRRLRRSKPRVVITEAVRVLRRGGVVIFPTETVYGLAADAANRRAIRRLRALKGRSSRKPLPLQVATWMAARRLVRRDVRFDRLARRFWPGPLTIVARARKGRPVGIRVPRHAFTRRLLSLYARPLAVTSVNPSGREELRTLEEILRFASGRVDLIIWRAAPRRAASTVVSLTGPRPAILRPGPVSLEDVNRCLKK